MLILIKPQIIIFNSSTCTKLDRLRKLKPHITQGIWLDILNSSQFFYMIETSILFRNQSIHSISGVEKNVLPTM
jgi:hypothetical protein